MNDKKSYVVILLGLGLLISSISCRKVPAPDQMERIDIPEAVDWHGIDIHGMRGIAVGGVEWEEGHIATTQDGGLSWKWQRVGPKALYGVAVSDSMWIACGNDGLVYIGHFGHETENIAEWRFNYERYTRIIVSEEDTDWFMVGGSGVEFGTYARVRFPQVQNIVLDSIPQMIESVASPTVDQYVMVGFGVVMHSTDGGVSWRKLDMSGAHYTDVCFLDETDGFLCSLGGKLWQTEDGGLSWTKIDLPFSTRGVRFRGVDGKGKHIFLACESGWIIYSNDRGINWRRVRMDRSIDFTDLVVGEEAVYFTQRFGAIWRWSLQG